MPQAAMPKIKLVARHFTLDAKELINVVPWNRPLSIASVINQVGLVKLIHFAQNIDLSNVALRFLTSKETT